MTDSNERRIDPRIPVRILMHYRLVFSPDGTPAEPELHNGNNLLFNLSRGGFFLSTKNFLEVGSKVQFTYPLDAVKGSVSGFATIVRANNYNYPTQGRYEYGFQFADLEEGSREALERFLKQA